ncbi:MAG: hypothetical protein HoeaKO_34480 [Hoeflea alexandrii]
MTSMRCNDENQPRVSLIDLSVNEANFLHWRCHSRDCGRTDMHPSRQFNTGQLVRRRTFKMKQ